MLAGQSANTSLETATAQVAFLPAVGQTHASRRCGREMGYSEVELGEGAQMRYEYLLKGAEGRECGKNQGTLLGGWWGGAGGTRRDFDACEGCC